jgi:hypothetical protein
MAYSFEILEVQQASGMSVVSMLVLSMSIIGIVSLVMIGKFLKDIKEALWWVGELSQGMLSKLSYIEAREMRAHLRCHELLRQLFQLMVEYNCEMDEWYLVRHFSSEVSQFFEARRESLGSQNAIEDVFSLLKLVLRCLVEQIRLSGEDGAKAYKNLLKIHEYEKLYYVRTGELPWGEQLLGDEVMLQGQESMSVLRRRVMNSPFSFELFQLQSAFHQVEFTWKA